MKTTSGTPDVKYDAEKNRALLDRVLQSSPAQLSEKITALLGCTVIFSLKEIAFITPKEFYQDGPVKRVISELSFDSEESALGEGYCACSVNSSIELGGAVVGLSADEIEGFIKEEDFHKDLQDAYGEVANVVAAVYSEILEKEYSPVKTRVTRKSISEVHSLKSDDTLIAQRYYCCCMSLTLKERVLDDFQVLFPAVALKISAEKGEEAEENEQLEEEKFGEETDSDTDYDVLLIGDDQASAELIVEILATRGFSGKTLSFKDEVMGFFNDRIKAVYLVMKEVNEQGLGMAIKISTSFTLPIIAVAPAWTRSKVVKAVKYGVRDILLIPASSGEIEKNIQKNIK